MFERMNKSLLFIAFAAAAQVLACSGSDGEIQVTASKSPLTANPNDALFDIDVKDASGDGYDLTGITVKAKPDGKDAFDVSCTPKDTNGNKKLDKGESLTCVEGATNVLGPDLGGTDVEIELHAKVDGDDTLVGKATWTPAK